MMFGIVDLGLWLALVTGTYNSRTGELVQVWAVSVVSSLSTAVEIHHRTSSNRHTKKRRSKKKKQANTKNGHRWHHDT